MACVRNCRYISAFEESCTHSCQICWCWAILFGKMQHVRTACCTIPFITHLFSGKEKIKCTLVQALRLCTGRTAHRGSRGIALPCHDYGTRRGWGVSIMPRPLFTPQYPLYRRLGGPQGRSGEVGKISPPPGFDPRTVQPVASRYTDWATRPTIFWCITFNLIQIN